MPLTPRFLSYSFLVVPFFFTWWSSFKVSFNVFRLPVLVLTVLWSSFDASRFIKVSGVRMTAFSRWPPAGKSKKRGTARAAWSWSRRFDSVLLLLLLYTLLDGFTRRCTVRVCRPSRRIEIFSLTWGFGGGNRAVVSSNGGRFTGRSTARFTFSSYPSYAHSFGLAIFPSMCIVCTLRSSGHIASMHIA